MARSELLRRHVEAADWLKSEWQPSEIRRSSSQLHQGQAEVHAAAAERAKSGGKPPAKPKPPAFKNGMTLRDYQVTSFEWMIGNYRRRTNVILGDEMGLGKTAQCISVMEHVRTEQLRAPRPFLVIAPLTTLGHWKREIEWTDMNVVLMDGNAKDREIIESTEFWFPGKAPGKGPASSTSFWYPSRPHAGSRSLIASFEWAACVCDEAHKLKDVNSLTTKAVMEIGYDWPTRSRERRSRTTSRNSSASCTSSTRRSTRAGSTSRRACSTAAAGRWTPSRSCGCVRCSSPACSAA